ncbi:pilus assembly protein CpaE [Nakamurella flava]|uniref:Pilus assembly protein CpaE n=1 Tax=Nakamurella flava TaxID=2576308 RepID=A0A4U6QLV5_9ACTN|nr:pilus assembly protein CpaE [Nakamurella flava]TKV61513.1 pilus assembly protein CpaE [Nakamurella flava]
MAIPSDSEDLPVPLAADLRAAGLRWQPAAGDRFVVTDGTLDGDVFTVSDMVVEVIGEGSGGQVLGFNGTTEWALDSVPLEATLWLPREGQLRRLLGRSFRRLEVHEGRFHVTVANVPGTAVTDAGPQDAEPQNDGPGMTGGGGEMPEQPFEGGTATEAYGRALLFVIGRALG